MTCPCSSFFPCFFSCLVRRLLPRTHSGKSIAIAFFPTLIYQRITVDTILAQRLLRCRCLFLLFLFVMSWGLLLFPLYICVIYVTLYPYHRVPPLSVWAVFKVRAGPHDCIAVFRSWFYGYMYVCMATHIARVWINRVRLPVLHVVSWTWKMNISLSTFVPENLVSWDGFGSPVPRQPAHLHTQAESGAYLRDSSRVPRRRPFIHL